MEGKEEERERKREGANINPGLKVAENIAENRGAIS